MLITPRAVFHCASLLFLLQFASCSHEKKTLPAATQSEAELACPLSEIAIPISYKVSVIEEAINTKIKGTFFESWIKLDKEGDSLYLALTRTQPVKLKWNFPVLEMEIPLNLKGNAVIRFKGLKIKNSTPVEAEVIVHLFTKVDLAKDWQLQLHSEIKKIDWRKSPQLKISILKINIEKPVNDLILKNRKVLTGILDEELSRALNLRKAIISVWQDIQKPVLINKKYENVWLKAEGKSLQAAWVTGNTEDITLGALFTTNSFFAMGAMPDTVNMPELPAYEKMQNEKKGINLFIKAAIPFDKANEILGKQILDKKITASGYSTTIRAFSLYGTEKGVAAKIKTEGDFTGDIIIHGTPLFIAASKRFAIKDPDFDLSTEDNIAKTADWLFHSNLIDLMKEKITLNLDSLLKALPNTIETAIENAKVGSKLNLDVESLETGLYNDSILITKNNIQFIIEAKGNIAIELEKKLILQDKSRVVIGTKK